MANPFYRNLKLLIITVKMLLCLQKQHVGGKSNLQECNKDKRVCYSKLIHDLGNQED